MNGARGVIVAGTHSGCGKTSVALGLMAALARSGLRVQPFKIGPDFIDPGHHVAAVGRTSHNLDGWMLPRFEMAAIFSRHCRDADAAVVEGAMGLFDGFSGSDEAGSAAAAAKCLGLPVLLVVDARSMARSAAALVKGFVEFDPDVRFAGVVCNRVASAGHREILEEALASLDTPVLGFLPSREELAMPSRHLGLVTSEDAPMAASRIAGMADWVEEHVDLRALLDLLPEADVMPGPGNAGAPPNPPRVRIGLARDRAFCFYYEENLRRLRKAGAALVPFSPMADRALPENLDGLYLGGGYPELYAEKLGANAALLTEVREFAGSGRPVYAECGGFMYLMRSLTDDSGREYPMAGVFPFGAKMGRKRSELGYREIATTAPSLLGPAGTVARGHEFHYSFLDAAVSDLPKGAYRMTGRKGPIDRPEGFLSGGTLGSYAHLHFGSNPEIAPAFVAACEKHGARRS